MVTCAVEASDPLEGGTYCTTMVQVLLGFTTAPEKQVPPVIENVPFPVAFVMVGGEVSVSGPAKGPVAVLVTVTVPVFVLELAGAEFNAGLGVEKATVAPSTVNGRFPVVPPSVVMLTFLELGVAPFKMVNVAVTVVSFTTVTPLTVTPFPDIATTVVPVRLVPVRVTGTLVPRDPELGVIFVSVGAGGLTTVNTTVLLVPFEVVTLTVLALSGALAAIMNVAVTDVSLTTLNPLTVTPAPETFTAEAPVRLVPVRVTGTDLPRAPVFGEIETRVGWSRPWNSTAPASTLPVAALFLGLPKKSLNGAAA
jgi:hypothetical protein